VLSDNLPQYTVRTNDYRILIADRSEPMQRWLAMATVRSGARASQTTYASTGPEMLYHLSHDGPFDLVVCQASLPQITGAQVLAMVRTAGLATPFVMLDYLPSSRLRALVARAGDATLVDTPLDSRAVRTAARGFLQRNDSSRGAVSATRTIAGRGGMAPSV